jgi:AcrR family transcriptional regulator
MGVAERRAREREALRQAILDAAGQLIVENGYENLSIRRIADRIEYSPATIYLYFKDKTEILASICIGVFSELTGKLHQIAQTSPDPLSALRRGLRCYIEFGLAHRSHYLVTFGSRWPRPEEPEPSLEETQSAGAKALDTLRQAIDRAVQAGQMPPGDTHLRAQIAWTAVHGLTSSLICVDDDPHFKWAPLDQLIDSMIDTIVSGFVFGGTASGAPPLT